MNLGKSLFTDSFSQRLLRPKRTEPALTVGKDQSLTSSLLDYISRKVSKLFTGNIKQGIKIPWWVEVKTISPECVYYFGPFETIRQARLNQDGYVEDLVEEKADGITIELKQCVPENLTIFAE